MRTALTFALLAILITGCGGVSGGDRPDEDATLLLDSAPRAVHAGIYLATARGYDEAEGVRLEVKRPGASADASEQLRTGRADFAILGWAWRHERHKVDLADFPNVKTWYERCMARPATKRGFEVALS